MHSWTITYFICVIQCVFYLFKTVRSQADFLSPSAIFSLTLLIWFYPKIPDLVRFTSKLGYWDIDIFLCFWLICQTVFYFASHLKAKDFWLANAKNTKIINENSWFIFTFSCCFIGAISFLLLTRLPPDMVYMSQPSGIITIYIFLAKFLTISLFCAIFLFVYSKSLKKAYYLIPITTGIFLYAYLILVHGQRSELFELMFVMAVLWILALGKKIPKVIILVAIVVMFAFNSIVSDYRQIVKREDSDLSKVSSIPVIERMSESVFRADYDIINAFASVESKNRPGQDLELGVTYWNKIIHAYFPGQFLGKSLKQSLRIKTDSSISEELKYIPPTGTTTFIAGGLFRNFGWLGFLPLIIYARIMRNLYLKAKTKDLVYLVLYSYYGAMIPVVIIFGLTWFTTSFIFWGSVFHFLNKQTSKYISNNL